MENKIWRENNGSLYLMQEAKETKKLDNDVFIVSFDERTGMFFLTRAFKEFTFDYKIYGIESNLITRIIKSYNSQISKNLGILFNGIKGTGKTVSAKLIANQIKQPTIIVNFPFKGVELFLNSIPQDITIFVDEYEKIYDRSNDLLTIMDGVMNSEFRRFFILTTNQLRIEDNLLQRPSRIRYLKEFSHLAPKIVEEIVDDLLINKKFKNETIDFIASLELITVDIVKAIIQEINVHDETPKMFEDIFNVKKNKGKYDVYLVNELNDDDLLIGKNFRIYPRPNFDENSLNYWFEIGNKNFGLITNIFDTDTIEITQFKLDSDGNITSEVDKILKLRMEESLIYHSNYSYGSNAKPLAKVGDENLLEKLLPKKKEKTVSKTLPKKLEESPMGISDCGEVSCG